MKTGCVSEINELRITFLTVGFLNFHLDTDIFNVIGRTYNQHTCFAPLKTYLSYLLTDENLNVTQVSHIKSHKLTNKSYMDVYSAQ